MKVFLILFMNKYYSQVNQDKFLNECLFKNLKNGFFLEIGAYDGITFSNTYFFEKNLNWSGYCFEPIPEYFNKLKEKRKAKCFNVCVGNKNSEVEFLHVKNQAMFSGISNKVNKDDFKKIKKENIQKIKSKLINIADFLKEYNLKEIHYVSLDIEGAEEEVLRAIDYNKTFIHSISVEDNQNLKKVDKILKKANFVLVKHCLFEKIFVNKRSKYFKNISKTQIIKAKTINFIIGTKFEKFIRNLLKKNMKLYSKLIQKFTR